MLFLVMGKPKKNEKPPVINASFEELIKMSVSGNPKPEPKPKEDKNSKSKKEKK
jgi:hypothetical protein